MKNTLKFSLSLIALALVILSGTAGCAGVEAGNTSARPWNEPRGYDTGIFGSGFGRRPY
tara:strand:+ start:339 stop:515 length:177 start_codon:yes stop_codon:yes gene_type:complete